MTFFESPFAIRVIFVGVNTELLETTAAARPPPPPV
jgi:hypothetical protein